MCPVCQLRAARRDLAWPGKPLLHGTACALHLAATGGVAHPSPASRTRRCRRVSARQIPVELLQACCQFIQDIAKFVEALEGRRDRRRRRSGVRLRPVGGLARPVGGLARPGGGLARPGDDGHRRFPRDRSRHRRARGYIFGHQRCLEPREVQPRPYSHGLGANRHRSVALVPQRQHASPGVVALDAAPQQAQALA